MSALSIDTNLLNIDLDLHVGKVKGQREHRLQQVNGGPTQVGLVDIACGQLHLKIIKNIFPSTDVCIVGDFR